MTDLAPIGRLLIVAGIVIAIAGVVLVLGDRIPFFGRLPGDIRIERDGLTIFLPIATMLLLSLALTIVVNLLGRGR